MVGLSVSRRCRRRGPVVAAGIVSVSLSFRAAVVLPDDLTHATDDLDVLGGHLWVPGSWHGQEREVFGADPAVLPAHVRVERVARLGHSAAQDAPEAVAVGMLVLHVGAEGVGVLVDLAADVAGTRVRGPHTVEVEAWTTWKTLFE